MNGFMIIKHTLKILQNCPNFQFHVCAFYFLFFIGHHPIIYVQLKVNIYKMILK